MDYHGYIYVIDDDTAIRDLIAEVLTDEGYTVLVAASGGDALSIIAAHRPALCLVDVRLAGMSGMEVLERLHIHGLGQVPIVLMTASTQDAALVRAAGIACLDKPFAVDDLLACVAPYVPIQQTLIARTA